MAVDVEQLIVELIAKTDKYVAGMNKADKATSTAATSMQSKLLKTKKSVKDFSDESTANLKKFGATMAAALSVRQLVEYSDTWNRVQNRLRIVSNSQKELANATQLVLGVAKDTRTDLEATALLYSRMARSTKELKLTQEELAEVTSIINKSFTISGATAAEASASIIQLSQAFSRGVLRGDEFRSVSEQAPEILKAVQVATGKTRGEIIKFAEQGVLSTELLIKSLQFYKENVDEAFAKTQTTISQALSIAKTDIVTFVGKVNDATGAVGTFSDVVTGLSGALADMSDPTALFLTQLADWIKEWEKAFGPDVMTQLEGFTEDYSRQMMALQSFTKVTVAFIEDAFTKMPSNIAAASKILGVEIAHIDRAIAQTAQTTRKNILDIIESVGTSIAASVGATDIEEAGRAMDALSAKIAANAKALQAKLDINAEARKKVIEDILKERTENTISFEKRLQEIRDLRAAPPSDQNQTSDDPAPIIDLDAEAAKIKRAKEIKILLKRDELKQKRIEKSIMGKLETIRTGLEEEIALFEEAAKVEVITEEQKQERILRARKNASAQTLKINRELEAKIQKMKFDTVEAALKGLSALVGGSDTASKAIFIVQQGLAASEVFFNTQVASMRALAELGPIAGPPAAAAIELKGAVSVAAIVASAIGGLSGGGGSLGSLGGGSAEINTRELPDPESVDFDVTIASSEGRSEGPITIVAQPGSSIEPFIDLFNEWIRLGVIKT